MKNEPFILKVHWWRRELTLLVTGTFFRIIQREKLFQEREEWETLQQWRSEREPIEILTQSPSFSSSFPMQSPETTAGNWTSEEVFGGSCCKREHWENKGGFREKLSWRYPRYPIAQKHFKFFHKMKEFEILIFKLTKIPCQNT